MWQDETQQNPDGFTIQDDPWYVDLGKWAWDQIDFGGESTSERIASIMAQAPPKWRQLHDQLERMPVELQEEYRRRAVAHVPWASPADLPTMEMVARYIACCEIQCRDDGPGEQQCVDAARDILAWSPGFFGGGGGGGGGSSIPGMAGLDARSIAVLGGAIGIAYLVTR